MNGCSCDKAKIENTVWLGEPAVKFCAGGYEALLVPGIGAEVIELKDPGRELNLLRVPLQDIEAFKARPQVYGIPVLFPPNRIEDGTFTAAGRVYNFPVNEIPRNNHIHGFLRTRSWNVSKTEIISDNEAVVEVIFDGNSKTDFYENFPHEFEFKMTYTLSGRGLEQKVEITNKSNIPMPMGLGFHTAFNVPFTKDGRPEDYRLMVSVGEEWELSERILPTGKLMPLNEVDRNYRVEGVVPQGTPISAHYTAKPLNIDGREFNGAILVDKEKGLKLVYEAGKDYKHWMIWNDSGNGRFICPEPQTWVVNAPNVKLPDEVTGFRMLSPGETWSDVCRIYAEKA